jgi:hypothetical protein
MKKATAGLIGALLVTMFTSNAWAHSGLRVDLGGGGFGFSVSDGHSGFSTFSYNNFQPYPYYYSGYYPNRPYLGWGGYKGYQHHRNNKNWVHPRSGPHNKGHNYNHRRGYKRDDHGQRRGNPHRDRGRQWRR